MRRDPSLTFIAKCLYANVENIATGNAHDHIASVPTEGVSIAFRRFNCLVQWRKRRDPRFSSEQWGVFRWKLPDGYWLLPFAFGLIDGL